MAGCLSPSQIDDYLHRTPAERERQAVEAHLETCPRCHDALVEREIERILPPEDPPVPPELQPAPERERMIGPYRLIRELGRGGQACVYLADDTRLPRKVAVKVFESGFAASQAVLLRFQREAAALSRLEHPGICTVYETGEWNGCPFIAMRYVEGETLAERIGRQATAKQRGEAAGRNTLLQTVAVVERAARALHAAHVPGQSGPIRPVRGNCAR